MTYARRIARRLSKYKWYYPHVASDDPNKPSLDAAWAYFEHITLGRHFLPKEGSKDLFQKAEVGENEEPTRLYSVLGTMETDLADFGDAVGVYFFTLRALAFMMFVAGLISLPNMIYYHSEEYSFKSPHFRSIFLQSSAICHDQTWEACPTCKLSDWSRFPVTYSRYANTTLPTGETLSFIRVNNCDVNDTVAFWAYASLLFVVFCVYLLDGITKEKELDFDAAQQTATDYALEVENPPEDARDPKEWLDFFEQFGRVTVLTIALDNEELTDPLLLRRRLLVKLKNLIPVGEEFDPERLDDMVAMANVPKFPMSLLLGTPEKLKNKILELEDEIRGCIGKIFPVSEVFVIFETEHAQRAAYKKLVVSGADVEDNNIHALPQNYVFRGDCVLNLIEPPEPSSVRWMDLDESAGVRTYETTTWATRRDDTLVPPTAYTVFLPLVILVSLRCHHPLPPRCSVQIAAPHPYDDHHDSSYILLGWYHLVSSRVLRSCLCRLCDYGEWPCNCLFRAVCLKQSSSIETERATQTTLQSVRHAVSSNHSFTSICTLSVTRNRVSTAVHP